jgi:hypothetical protein
MKRRSIDWKMKLFLACILLILSCSAWNIARGQVSHGGTPYGYSLKSSYNPEFVAMPHVDNDAMIARDQYTWKKKGPLMFGEKTDVDLGLDNSGSWQDLGNGDRIWNLGIRSSGAYSINLIFSEFLLPEGARVFIYNEEKTDFIGSFDHTNNKANGILATNLVRGEAVIIEYYEPEAVIGSGKLRVGSVTHAYRDVYKKAMEVIPGYGSSDPCTININCPQGDDWQLQSRSVVMLLINGSSFCSGTLLNNVNNDGRPYVLTADHCLGKKDPANIVSLFNYESPVCENAYTVLDNTISGSVIRARSSSSDFALLEMSSPPPASYNAIYSGWTNSDTTPERFICIGHPSGDIKKWSEERPRKSKEAEYWYTSPRMNAGQTENGSSGSGVWDQNGRLVGQLYGGAGWCSEVNKINYWGGFFYSWDKGASDSARLKDWLDPGGTNAVFIDHFDPNASSSPEITYQVNMNYIENFAEGSSVRLNFVDSGSRVEMSDINGDGVYACSVPHDTGADLRYYFSYRIGTDSDTVYLDERDMLSGTECCNTIGHRIHEVEARNQILLPVIFGSCLAYPRMPEVTLMIDMSRVTDLYPLGGVWVSFGNWNSWWVLKDEDGTGVYAATGQLEAGTSWKYFFGYQTGPNENSDYVGEKNSIKGLECTDDNGFRSLTVPEGGITIPAVFYSSCVESTTSLIEPAEKVRLSLSYNQAYDLLRIINAREVESVEIFSITGQLLLNVMAGGQESIEINTSALQSGVYIVRCKMAANNIQAVRFVK